MRDPWEDELRRFSRCSTGLRPWHFSCCLSGLPLKLTRGYGDTCGRRRGPRRDASRGNKFAALAHEQVGGLRVCALESHSGVFRLATGGLELCGRRGGQAGWSPPAQHRVLVPAGGNEQILCHALVAHTFGYPSCISTLARTGGAQRRWLGTPAWPRRCAEGDAVGRLDDGTTFEWRLGVNIG